MWNAVDHKHIVPFLKICKVENNFPGLISLYIENGLIDQLNHIPRADMNLGDVKCYLENNPDGDRYILMMGIALGLEFLHSNQTIRDGGAKE